MGAEDDGVPEHDVVLPRGAAHPGGGVLLGVDIGSLSMTEFLPTSLQLESDTRIVPC